MQRIPFGQQPNLPGATSSDRARPHSLLLIGLAMMAFVIVLYVTRSHSGSPLPSSSARYGPEETATNSASPGRAGATGFSDDRASATPEARTISSADNPAVSAPSTSGDAVEEAARRAVKRESPNIGLPPAAAASTDGKVHLRSGGTITPDEWNEARQKLKDSPLLREPPSPPPF